MRTKVANYFPAITGVHSRFLSQSLPYAYTSLDVRMIPSADRGTVITKPLRRAAATEGRCTTPSANGNDDDDDDDDDDDNDNGGDDDASLRCRSLARAYPVLVFDEIDESNR